jgi:hypothetical protein
VGFSFESSRLLINLYAKLHKIMLCTVSETPLLAWSCLTGRGDSLRRLLSFAGSVLVAGREQLPLLPKPRVSIPKQSISTLSAHESVYI